MANGFISSRSFVDVWLRTAAETCLVPRDCVLCVRCLCVFFPFMFAAVGGTKTADDYIQRLCDWDVPRSADWTRRGDWGDGDTKTTTENSPIYGPIH